MHFSNKPVTCTQCIVCLVYKNTNFNKTAVFYKRNYKPMTFFFRIHLHTPCVQRAIIYIYSYMNTPISSRNKYLRITKCTEKENEWQLSHNILTKYNCNIYFHASRHESEKTVFISWDGWKEADVILHQSPPRIFFFFYNTAKSSANFTNNSHVN